MKVILLKNIPKLGKLGDIKEVSTGYARNYLLPQNLASEATLEAISGIESMKTKMAKEAESELREAEKMAQTLEGITVEISAKASEEGTLYSALPVSKIVSALEDKGYKIKKENINSGHIKELGDHEVVINLTHGLEARITVIVNPQ